DIQRIVKAFSTDSKAHREKLVAALHETKFVMAVDAANGSKWVCAPSELYIATERLKELFAGVQGVLLVDDSYPCLHGEDVRELLEASGATRRRAPKGRMRIKSGSPLDCSATAARAAPNLKNREEISRLCLSFIALVIVRLISVDRANFPRCFAPDGLASRSIIASISLRC